LGCFKNDLRTGDSLHPALLSDEGAEANAFCQGGVVFGFGIRLLTTKPITPQKYISLVEIAGDVFALGISESQITLITKVENREFLEKVAARRSVQSEPPSLLQQISKGSRWMKGMSLRVSHEK